MLFNYFKKPQQMAKQRLIILGTDFGSYRINQLVNTSSEYSVVGFICDDPWQRKADFEKVGVYYSSELGALCGKQPIAGIILPSDQQAFWLENSNKTVLEGLQLLVKPCDLTSIPANISTKTANQFLAKLLR